MSTRRDILKAVEQPGFEELETLIRNDRGVIRYLVGFSFQAGPGLRQAAAHGLAFAARLYPTLVQEVARRLVWAMNDESGAYGVTAPEILLGIARQAPELLVPLVPDLLRLSSDPALSSRLVEVVRTVARGHPGETVQSMERSLGACFHRGDADDRLRHS
jgi:hypothetical protein